MDWWLMGLFLLGAMFLLFATGFYVAFTFLVITTIGMFVFMGGTAGLQQLILSIHSTLCSFVMVPVALFLFLGEFLFHTQVANRAINVVDMFLGRLPGKLSVVAIAAGAMMGFLSGSSMGSALVIGTVLEPEMRQRGYSKHMTAGPIMAGATLAVIIPPSILTIILGTLAEVSIGELLIGGVIPGLLLGCLCAIYVVVVGTIRPSEIPRYAPVAIPLSQKILSVVRDLLPLGLVVFLLTGIIFLGVATPSEAAATGVIGGAIVAAGHKRVNLQILRKSMIETARLTATVLFIIGGSNAFSQLAAFTGVTQGFVSAVLSLPVPPPIILGLTLLIILFLGCFIDQMSMMMITVPLMFPIMEALGYDLVWYGMLYLIVLSLGMLTPPFGLLLFTMKSIVPHFTMGEIYRTALPHVIMMLVGVGLLWAFPQLVLVLPQMMR